jgi:Nif-specific regulatory protein
MKTAKKKEIFFPRLICLEGTLKGEIFPLDREETTLGRLPSNHIQIPDPCISRRHARITRRGKKYFLIDLKSLNGTRVNGLDTPEALLRGGDEIRIKDNLFLFAARPDEVRQPTAGRRLNLITDPGEDKTVNVRTSLPPDDSSLVTSGGDETPAASYRRINRVLDLLQRIAGSGEESGRGALLSRVVRLLREHFRAENACILLLDRVTGRLEPAAAASPQGSRTVRLSKTIAERVLKEKTALLCEDGAADARLAQAESAVALNLRSLICSPLITRGSLLGLVYLDNRSSPGRFSDLDLRSLKVISNQLALLIQNFDMLAAMRDEVKQLQEQVESEKISLIGKSPAIARVIDMARKAAESDSAVLILGESGTGKEVLAQAIHRWSRRREKPLVVVNCAALTPQLMESELFGHEKGAFTGAFRQKKGKLEAANGGTIFLDEIGDIEPGIQVKLLRFLEEHELERVGGSRPIKVDARVLAATNRDLKKAVEDGSFRLDLYYRLCVVELPLPPLRERKEDIPLLAQDFLRSFTREMKKHIEGFSREARDRLQGHDWPGNIRELKNVVERAVVFAAGRVISADELNLSPPGGETPLLIPGGGYHEQVRELKRRVLLHALDRNGGVKSRAARELGLQLSYLSRLLKNLGLR